MIRVIDRQETISPIVDRFCKHLLKYQASSGHSYTGEVDTNYSTRISLSTDNSIYQSIPQGVLFPKSTSDLEVITQLANKAEYKSIRFSPRGGGTGTNGQSLTEHLIVDMSRHMRDILEINEAEGWVRVQAGVIKDQLNDFLKPFGFFFAPDLSTSNRATIGGMVNTDASGQGSLVYGKTSDHVLELTAVTIDGSLLKTKKLSLGEARIISEQTSKIGRITKQALDTTINYREQIVAKFPRLNRFLTGYDLENTWSPEAQELDLSRLLAGSEGTLAFITEAKLNVTPIAKFKTLINIKYDSFDSALRNSPFLVAANATSVETVDSKVLSLAKDDVVWQTVSDLIQDVPGKNMNGLNMVEFNDEDETNQKRKVESLCQRLDKLIESNQQGVIGYQLTTDLNAISRIYGMRKKAVGLLGKSSTSKKPIAFVEDTAVPPESLADFIDEFKTLLDSYQLDYGMFGHVDAGVLHVRPALDLTDPEQEKLLRIISDRVAQLTAKYGGLMWGEHGKGYRSEYGPEFFGETLFTELRKIKAVFDPGNRLNPGKICTPIDSQENMVSVDGVKRAKFDKAIPIAVKQVYESTVNCNGNGLCFNYDANSPMCPSYKATKDRRNSPKGRASLMREWLRLQGNNNSKLRVTSTFGKLKSTMDKLLGKYDFSHEVKQSMDLCLACKACTTACPIKVDVPTFRSKFLTEYHTRYLRSPSDYLVAYVEDILPKLARIPLLSNLIAFNPISRWVTRDVFGYVDAPQFSQSLFKSVPNEYWYKQKELAGISDTDKERYVLLVQDPFTSFYESELVLDTLTALEFLGFKPRLIPFTANGKPAHVKGFDKKFIEIAKRSTRKLNKIARQKVAMIGLDASLVFAYRDEYIKELGQDLVKFKVSVLSEWLLKQKLPNKKLQSKENYKLMAHCTEKSLMTDVNKQWYKVFQDLGLSLQALNSGCCGMAGTFGHEKANQEISAELYRMSWQEKVQLYPTTILATGFSCRSQVKRFDKVKVKHPIQIVAQLSKY